MRKVLAVIFFILAAILVLAAVGQLGTIILSVAHIFRVLAGKSDADEAGYAIGRMIYWIFHFFLIYILIKYGRRWYKAKD